MEQNDIVAQIMALIGQKNPQRHPMIAGGGFPATPPPPGILPQKGGMPPGAEDIALQTVLEGADPAGWAEEGPLTMQGYKDLLQSRGTSPEEVLPPEILELVLQGKMSPSPQPPKPLTSQRTGFPLPATGKIR